MWRLFIVHSTYSMLINIIFHSFLYTCILFVLSMRWFTISRLRKQYNFSFTEVNGIKIISNHWNFDSVYFIGFFLHCFVVFLNIFFWNNERIQKTITIFSISVLFSQFISICGVCVLHLCSINQKLFLFWNMWFYVYVISKAVWFVSIEIFHFFKRFI